LRSGIIIAKRYTIYAFILPCIFILYVLHIHYKAEDVWIDNSFYLLEGQAIKIVTYNIQYGRGQDGKVNLQKTINTLRELDADIISLQEVERLSFRSGFEEQVQIMAKELGMNGVFFPSLSYPGLSYGNAILSRFPIMDAVHLPLRSQYEDRSVMLVDMQLSEDQTMYVLNTHLGLDHEERARDIGVIYELLQTLDSAFILTGDLNSTPDQMEYEIWTDILHKSNKGQPLQTYFSREWQIDYIFHSDHFSTLESWVVESDASDHFPVVALLEMK
jgi:endonuclease/exonuclease/phosphatase family metal-dependent hydrolase